MTVFGYEVNEINRSILNGYPIGTVNNEFEDNNNRYCVFIYIGNIPAQYTIKYITTMNNRDDVIKFSSHFNDPLRYCICERDKNNFHCYIRDITIDFTVAIANMKTIENIT